MTALEAAVQGLIQGLTEFLPVSSSGHLALYQGFLKLHGGSAEKESLAFSVLLHVASLCAVLFVFRREVWRLFFDDRRLGLFIVIGTIPAVAAGLAFHDVIEAKLNRPIPAAVCLLVTGAVLVSAELVARRRRSPAIAEQAMTLWQVIGVGIAQAIALLPGVSRSGMTMGAGRAMGLGREASVRFAFLLGVPAIAGAACYESLKAVLGHADPDAAGIGWKAAAAGFLVSLVVSWAALVFLIRVVRRYSLWVFAPYCFALGAAALFYFAWR